VPIVHFSVNWWNTLHQGSTVRLLGPSRIDSSMLWPLLLMALATHLWFFASVLARARASTLEPEAYVWSSFAIFVIALLLDFIAPRIRYRKIKAELRGRYRRQKNRQEKAA
jgi:heme exporter protein CcmD